MHWQQTAGPNLVGRPNLAETWMDIQKEKLKKLLNHQCSVSMQNASIGFLSGMVCMCVSIRMPCMPCW